ncbi:uncharacterized protein BDW47DRAFT_4017 [Aspergillus candidus]|uniref:Uncharacterized protein n=1 Tax=Aspergillus candidus TaxID=41067 RepID=A0A2I2FH32_ASPCN|nr:hypothetical protein BDW47DRAFT_4017 [Aspergillus candidus]PLB39933.1 hypothetical protein BDW47DRAFT_4017 [Aspergillus candidus]
MIKKNVLGGCLEFCFRIPTIHHCCCCGSATSCSLAALVFDLFCLAEVSWFPVPLLEDYCLS